MQLAHYNIHLRFTEPAVLPEYKGSTLRGHFGHSLKKVSCALRRQSCSDCMLRTQCVYALTFEAQPSSDNQPSPTRPHPYVLVAPESQQRQFEPDETLTMGLKVFGSFNQYLPYYVYALDHLGQWGLGKQTNQGCGRFNVEQVLHGQTPLYDRQQQLLHIPQQLPRLQPQTAPPAENGCLTVTWHTPLRVKQDNRLQAQLPFVTLVRAALRRVSSLYTSYGNQLPQFSYTDLVRQAEHITADQSQLAWQDIPRYSNRQKTSMLLGGLVGTVHYYGQLGPYLPLLELASHVHVGKQTAFGLGRFSYQWQPEAA